MVVSLPAWRALQVAKRAGRKPATRRARSLTGTMEATIVDDDRVILDRLIQEAETPEERRRVEEMTPEQRRAIVDLVESDPDRGARILGRLA
jgi:hypothetical protein